MRAPQLTFLESYPIPSSHGGGTDNLHVAQTGNVKVSTPYLAGTEISTLFVASSVVIEPYGAAAPVRVSAGIGW